jgi:hypothetical protein
MDVLRDPRSGLSITQVSVVQEMKLGHGICGGSRMLQSVSTNWRQRIHGTL